MLSPVSTASYTITGTADTPIFTPSPGTYTTSQSLALTTTTAGATIRYTCGRKYADIERGYDLRGGDHS